MTFGRGAQERSRAVMVDCPETGSTELGGAEGWALRGRVEGWEVGGMEGWVLGETEGWELTVVVMAGGEILPEGIDIDLPKTWD